MANAAAKKQAASNHFRLKVLLQGFAISHVAHLYSLWLRPQSRTTTHWILYGASTFVSLGIWIWLQSIGTPKYDATGNLISAGEDLMQPGLTDYLFDVIFITWAVHIASALVGSLKFFWLFALIPAFIGERAWTNYIYPWIRSGRNAQAQGVAAPQEQSGTSRRQAKMQARADGQAIKRK